MDWNTIQQLIRMLANLGGGVVFGDAIVKGDLFQAAIGGLLAILAFAWWFFWNRNVVVKS